ncbi:hypothetical protein LB505_012786 [Fusarium chuoi]|nr:hypothetical protein LB505_012786 [Fusarium chuoi]
MTSTHPDIDSKVRKGLEGTKFEVLKLDKITGGSVNWIYKAQLVTPLDNGEKEALVKHGEPYMASKPEFALPPLRCRVSRSYRASHHPTMYRKKQIISLYEHQNCTILTKPARPRYWSSWLMVFI